MRTATGTNGFLGVAGVVALLAVGCAQDTDAWQFRATSGGEDGSDGSGLPPLPDLGSGTTSGTGTESFGDTGITGSTGTGGTDPSGGSTGGEGPCCCDPDQFSSGEFGTVVYPGPCAGEVGSWFMDGPDTTCVIADEYEFAGFCFSTVECFPCWPPSTLPDCGAVAASESPCIHMIGD